MEKEDLPCATCEGRCPELMPENAEAFELLQAGGTQLRVGGMGGVIGFDYNALALLADALGTDLSRALWRKVRAVEVVMRKQEAKRAEIERAKRS